jgi:hypothetical protein
MVGRLIRLRVLLCESGARAIAGLHARPLLWACLLAGAVSGVSAGPLAPSFLTNDDVAMAAAVDGSALGEPVPHMVFSNVAIGLLLSSLYSLAGLHTVPWYGICLFTLHFVALAVILYVVLADRRPAAGVRLLATASWLAVFGLRMGTRITFTQVAFLLGAAGVLLYLARASGRQAHLRTVALAGALLGGASLMRRHAMYEVVVLALPALLLAIRRIPWRRQVLFAATTLGMLLFGWAFQTAYYADAPDWQQYFAFNRARGGVESRAVRAAIDQEVLDAVGWSQNDLSMFNLWFFADADVYTTESFDRIHELVGNPALSPAGAIAALRPVIRIPSMILGLSLTAALLVATWVRGGFIARWFIALSTIWSAAVASVLLFFARLPVHVALTMLSFLALLLFVAPATAAPDMGSRPSGRGARVTCGLAVLVAAVTLVMGSVYEVAGSDERRADDQNLDRLLAGLQVLDADGVFVPLSVTLGTGRRSPWHAPVLPEPAFISLGWRQHSPIFDAQLARAGIEDLIVAMGSRVDVYVPVHDSASSRAAEGYATYLEEHYGFSGLLRPKAREGEYVIFDLIVAYELDDTAGVITERRLDGTEVRYPLVDDVVVEHRPHGTDVRPPSGDRGIVGAIRRTLVPDGVRVRGWAADLDSGGPVDHIVVFDGDEATAVALPSETLTEAAARRAKRLGVTDPGCLGFRLVAAASTLHNIRVFALSDGRAAELTP